MPRERLRELLEELDQELDALTVHSEEDRTRVTNLRTELRRLRGADLPSSADAEHADAEHAEGLRRAFEALREFEDRHPSLTGFVTQVSDVLARMGL